MEDRRLIPFFNAKLLTSFSDFRWVFVYCLFSTTLKLVLSSSPFDVLHQNPVDPGQGVKFYETQKTSVVGTLVNGLTLRDIQPRDCSKAPKNTSCIQRSKFFQDPSFVSTVVNRPLCDFSSPYRNYDGTCINPVLPTLGMANDCYFRFTPPYYDGYGGFRKTTNGNPLPSPRFISLSIFQDQHQPENNLSFFFLSFGQLIAHDISRAIQPQTDCCSPENAQKEECVPIYVRRNDSFYSQFKKTCLDFKRSQQCTLGKTVNREQTNGATAALDCSFIYGVSEKQAKQLRTFNGTGRLNFTDTNRLTLLPNGKDPEDIFCPKEQESTCFIAGDPRVNQHASLTGLQTVLMREHNRIAKELKKINPDWEEEKLFQQSRRVLIAEFQVIVYKDFMPILLSPSIMDQFGMTIEKGSKGSQFDPAAAIAVWHEIAHGAFRMHSMVPKYIGLGNLQFRYTFSNPGLIDKGYTADLIKGSQRAPSEKFDRYMITDFTDYLYEQPGVPYGGDLAATNIQRGRDHGIAPYVETVKFCSGATINVTSFEDLDKFKLMSTENAQLLQRVYASVEDVDLWVGLQLENHMNGSPLGPSAVCLNAKQFFFTQKADRLFFNHVDLVTSFTADQRKTLKNSSIGRIVCDNTPIRKITKNPFHLESSDNPEIPCEETSKVDLSYWKENDMKKDISSIL